MTSQQLPRFLTYQNIPLWRHVLIIQWTAQIVSAIVVVALVVWFFANISSAIQDRDIPFGWSFLDREYQTPIGEHFIPYESSDTFLYALGVAVTNTVIVAVAGVILAIFLGIFIGVARLSGNWLVSRLALVYIEFFRNVPLLVQLLFWLFIILALPPVREGYVIANALYINNSGISMPWPLPLDHTLFHFPVIIPVPVISLSIITTFQLAVVPVTPALLWIVIAVIGIIAGLLLDKHLSRKETETGKSTYPFISGVAATLLIGAAAWLLLSFIAGESPFALSVPGPEGRFGRIAGGFTARAGLLVLLVGLVIYTAAFIAEIVRAGIQSVGRGQTEAARALGLSPVDTLRRVIFPQALRVIIPPLISQCLNLTKNSSLGGAVGYTDLTNVAVTMTQTAPAISIFILIMGAYLAMSLTWSLIGNIYNRRIQFGSRR